MFEFIRDNQNTIKADFILWTGDNSVHADWDSKEMNTNSCSELLHRLNDVKIDEKLVEKYNGRFLNLEISSKHTENCNCTYCQNPLEKVNEDCFGKIIDVEK